MPRFHNINGERVQYTASEETARDAEEKVYADGADARAMAKIRLKRDNLLVETDWRFRSDQTPSQALIDYCQALRDLPANTSDLLNPTWPTKPE